MHPISNFHSSERGKVETTHMETISSKSDFRENNFREITINGERRERKSLMGNQNKPNEPTYGFYNDNEKDGLSRRPSAHEKGQVSRSCNLLKLESKVRRVNKSFQTKASKILDPGNKSDHLLKKDEDVGNSRLILLDEARKNMKLMNGLNQYNDSEALSSRSQVCLSEISICETFKSFGNEQLDASSNLLRKKEDTINEDHCSDVSPRFKNSLASSSSETGNLIDLEAHLSDLSEYSPETFSSLIEEDDIYDTNILVQLSIANPKPQAPTWLRKDSSFPGGF